MKDRKKKKQKGDPGVQEPPDVLSRLKYFARDYYFFILFVLIYIVYNTVTRMSWSGDVVPAEYLPIALILNQTVYFDSVMNMAEIGPNLAYAFPLVNGHYVSWFPIVTPVLVTPFYFLSCIPLIISGTPLTNTLITLMAKSSAAILAALSCVFLYLAIKELFSPRTATITALVYAFATSTWSVSSQALWQHDTVELLLVVMIWLVIRNERNPSLKNIICLGLVSGLFLFNRPSDSVLLLPVIGYIIWYERKNLPVYGISAAASGLPFLVYNLSVFGSIFGGYKQNLPLFSFGTENIANFAGLLIAPNVGLLIFSPVLVLSVFGYLKLDSISSVRIRQVLAFYGPVIILQILVYSFFEGWDSSVAYSYGQRYLTGLVPVLAIYLGIVVNDLFPADRTDSRKQALRAAFILLVAVSVIIQAIGVFLYPYYLDRGTNPERNWDWNHPIVVESFTYGISRVDSITTYSYPPLPALFHYAFSSGEK
jgi:Dolichyl-phosphate-mannose-protein mannosyltransferase